MESSWKERITSRKKGRDNNSYKSLRIRKWKEKYWRLVSHKERRGKTEKRKGDKKEIERENERERGMGKIVCVCVWEREREHGIESTTSCSGSLMTMPSLVKTRPTGLVHLRHSFAHKMMDKWYVKSRSSAL